MKQLTLPFTRDEHWPAFRSFQQEGIEFLESTDYNAILADDVGLGKTIQTMGLIHYNFNDLKPCLYVVKSTLKYQFLTEHMKWVRAGWNGQRIPIIVKNGDFKFIPGLNFYIISMDLLSSENIQEGIKIFGFKLIVLDEFHSFKNLETKRTQGMLEVVKHIPHRIFLSATPVLNRATEYFPALSVLDPEEFNDFKSFRSKWVQYNYKTNSWGGILPYMQAAWEKRTSKYILRRLKEDILDDLPSFARYMQFVTSEDSQFIRAYKKEQANLWDFIEQGYYAGEINPQQHILAIIARLRHLVGIAKAAYCIDLLEEFLDNGKDEKIAIGVHHRAVAAILTAALTRRGTVPVTITGTMTPEQRHTAVLAFENTSNRVLIASTQAAGEGLNLQCCSRAILLERQWNPAREKQFEGRFHRMGQTKPVEVIYLLIKGSIDEWMHQLVEGKRAAIATVQNEKEYQHPESTGGMKESLKSLLTQYQIEG